MRTIIRDGDHEYLVDQETGEIIYTRTAEDALRAPLWDSHEIDSRALGHALIELPKAAARLLLALVDNIRDGNVLTRDPVRLAQDAGMGRSSAFNAVKQLMEAGILKGDHLHPIYAYDAPYGLESYDRLTKIRRWYTPESNRPYLDRLMSLEAYEGTKLPAV